MVIPRRGLLVLVVATALAAAGCGSDEPEATATAAWANDLCSALTTWTGALTSSVESLQGGTLSLDAFESAANDAKGATETLVDDLRALGTPDTEAGEEARSAIADLSDQLTQDVAEIESAIGDVSGVSGIVAAVSTVSTTLSSMGSQLSSTLSSLQQLDAKGELESALSEAAACKDLVGS